MPQEDDSQTALMAGQGGNPDSGSVYQALAPAAVATGASPNGRPKLGPRAYSAPVMVWIGRTPPSTAIAEKADEEKPASKPARPIRQKSLSRTARPATVPAAAQAFTATQPKSIIEEGSATKTLVEPSAALKPAATKAKAKPGAVASGSAPRPKLGAIGTKPEPNTAAVAPAAADRKPAANKNAAAVQKPALASKPVKPNPKAKAAETKKPQVAAEAKTKDAKAKPKTN
jgi:hypothetical protein